MLQQATESSIPKGPVNSGWMSQFGHPRGWRGWVVGQLMAIKNTERSMWVLSLLELGPADRVLEIGFGSGADIRRVAAHIREGFVVGIDHSEAMVRLASAKNAKAIGAGHVTLRQGSASNLAYESNSFDVVYSINVAQFWDKPEEVAREIRRVLKPGGQVALAIQPRNKGATEATALKTGEKLVEALSAAGFSPVRLERKLLPPVSVVCALAIK
jgi:ubiquinone/menaquinone biosynthesis C-methylase UbiE